MLIARKITEKRVGLIGISLPEERTDIALDALTRARSALVQTGFEAAGEAELALSEDEVLARVQAFAAADIGILVYLLGTWLEAPMVVNAVERNPGMYPVIWAIPSLPSFSLVAAGVIKGALDDMGRTYGFIYGDPDDPATRSQLQDYLCACAAVRSLRRARLGIFGGRSLGMYTSTVDELQYKATFGTEIEHVDQLRLVKCAEQTPAAEVEQSLKELREMYRSFAAPDATLEKSVRLLLALSRIAQEERFDFLGVKCLGEVINYYGSCCLAVSVLNDRGVPTACQADIPAAFAMKFLSELSGEACAFADLVHVDLRSGLARLVNCGTMPTSLAADPGAVCWGWQYEYMGKQRGATPIFSCRSGPASICCLVSVRGRLSLQVASVRVEEHSLEDLAEVRDIWPQAFVKVDGDPERLVRSLRSNHVIMAYGDLKARLRHACALWGIEFNGLEDSN